MKKNFDQERKFLEEETEKFIEQKKE